MKTTKKWSVDPMHTKIQFSVKHMVIAQVTGEFKKYDLNISKMNGDIETAQVEFSIDASTVDTGIGDRDKHLKSPDFFDVEKYPEIHFQSTSIKKTDDETYKMNGNLTIKDVTKPIELKVTYGGQIVDPWGNIRSGYNIEGTINRFDFNLTWNNMIETGGAVVGKNVKINSDIEIVTPK
jgi:polyisoprenoid-binding protein YceI